MGNLRGLTTYKYIIIDGMNYAHRCFYGISLSYNEVITGMLYGFANLLITQKKKNRHAKFIVLWEGTESWRKKKYSYYKENRNNKGNKDDFYNSLNVVIVGVYQVYQDDLEADDLAAYFANKYERVLLISNDRDWQLLLNKADVMVKDTILDEDNYNPNLFWIKVIRGDTSDNISASLPRIQSKQIDSFISKIKKVEDIPVLLKEIGLESWANKAISNMDRLRENVELITLHDEMVDPSKFKYIDVNLDVKRAEEILSGSGMSKMVFEYEQIGYRINKGK